MPLIQPWIIHSKPACATAYAKQPKPPTFLPITSPMQRPDTPTRFSATTRLGHRGLAALALATLAACANFSGIEPSARPLDAGTLGLKNLDASKASWT